MKPIIRVENLSKQFTLGKREARYSTFRESLVEGARGLGHRWRPSEPPETLWALEDVSFEIMPGEAVGIIGRNGAGKSTLLKVLSRITDPTKGRIELYGRVASLLEVGTGFHPELTGRENIFLNGAILGMKRVEIAAKFDEIVEFAEVGRFIDTPVKRYSSGMYLKLAFAVAAHLEPEILVVDEVLAVGDAAFQKKCLGKMRDVAGQGRTVLFVSHQMQAVSTLTQRCLMLSKGRLKIEGPTPQVIGEYLREGAEQAPIYTSESHPDEPRVTRVEVLSSEPGSVQINGAAMRVRFEITAPGPVKGASLSFNVLNELGQMIMHLWTFDSERPMCREAGVFEVTCIIPKLHLYMGRYSLMVHFSERAGGRKFQTLEGICPFEVTMFGKPREFKWQAGTCAYLEDCDWTVEEVSSVNGR